MSGHLERWRSLDEACDVTVKTCCLAAACYCCVYGGALHRANYKTPDGRLCACSAWWCAGAVPCVGAALLRRAVGGGGCANVAADTLCCACTGAPCAANDYRTHNATLHDLLIGSSMVFPASA